MHDPSRELTGDQLVNLAERVYAGDRNAEDDLVQYFSPRIYIVLCARTRDREVSRDLLQDVLIAVLRALRQGQLRESSKLAAFILGIARNIAQSHLRDGRHSREEPLGREPAGPAFTDQLETSQREMQVQRALAGLDSTDREILRLTLVDGQKPGAIAEALGLSSDVVRQRKSRATKKVAEFVKTLSRTAGAPLHE
jgi:RNA polymerase sigma factor (sigma-70 family)